MYVCPALPFLICLSWLVHSSSVCFVAFSPISYLSTCIFLSCLARAFLVCLPRLFFPSLYFSGSSFQICSVWHVNLHAFSTCAVPAQEQAKEIDEYMEKGNTGGIAATKYSRRPTCRVRNIELRKHRMVHQAPWYSWPFFWL